MSYQILARKYRPQKFEDVVGQESVTRTLTNAVGKERLASAYLFCGPRGVGKTSVARIVAKVVNCENPSEQNPCGKCVSCLEVTGGNSIDVLEIDGASNNGVDEIRALRENVKFSPSKGKYKVYIIDEIHMLSTGAFNALLKTLEEPPSHAIFILATTEIHKMIPTIISRCQRFDFRRLTLEEIVKRLNILAEKEKVKVDKTALELIALNSGGAFRDAEGLLGQAISFCGQDKEITAEEIKDLLGLVEVGLVSQFCDFLSQKKAAEAIKFINEITEKGSDLQEFTKSLINYLRQGLILKIMGLESANPIITGLTKEELEKLQKQASSLQEHEIRRMIELFLDAENKMRYSSILQLPLELAVIESCQLA